MKSVGKIITLSSTKIVNVDKDELLYVDLAQALSEIKDFQIFTKVYTHYQLKHCKIHMRPIPSDPPRQPIVYALGFGSPERIKTIKDLMDKDKCKLKLTKQTNEDLIFDYDCYCHRKEITKIADPKQTACIGCYFIKFECILHIEFDIYFS